MIAVYIYVQLLIVAAAFMNESLLFWLSEHVDRTEAHALFLEGVNSVIQQKFCLSWKMSHQQLSIAHSRGEIHFFRRLLLLSAALEEL